MREDFLPIDTNKVNCFCCNEQVEDFKNLGYINGNPTDICLKCYKLYKDNENDLKRIRLLAKFIKRISYGSITEYDLLEFHKPEILNVHKKVLNSLYFSNKQVLTVKEFKKQLHKMLNDKGYRLRQRDMHVFFDIYVTIGWLCVFNSNKCFIDLEIMG